MKFIKFRLAHLFLLLLLVCGSLWVTTQHGIEVAEIEISQFDTVALPGPIEDGFEVPQLELVKVSYRYLEPVLLRHVSAQIFLRPFVTQRTFEPGQRLKYRYRTQPVLWLKQTSPDQIALQKLGIDEDSIEEMITESGNR